MAKPVILSNGRNWKTLAAAKGHFKNMLARYSDEDRVEDAGDHQDLVSLLERYDELIDSGPTKIGCGIDFFFRRRNVGAGWSTPGFWVRRTDGTETDFSYDHGLRGQPSTISQDFYQACRAAVEADLLAAKRRFFQEHPAKDEHGFAPCEVSGALINFDLAHMDHAYPTFNQLVLGFRAARGWSHQIPENVLTPPQDGQARATFIDPTVAEAFKQFHHSQAVLRVISSAANLSMAGRQRVPKIKYKVKL